MVHNRLKRVIYASDELELLQRVLEPDTRLCSSKDIETPRGLDCEIPEAFLVRMWKSLLNRRVLKS